MKKSCTIALLGNPNCGKTTLFNALTGSRQQVGNWPGVTVTRKTGSYAFQDTDFNVVDLPGTYSLDISMADLSLDERITREYIQNQEADLIINILDASNLERHLYLSLQLLETQTPMLVALNMTDVAKKRGIQINPESLAAQLGCPVIPLVAATGDGIPALKTAIQQALAHTQLSTVQVIYADSIEKAIHTVQTAIETELPHVPVNSRTMAIRLLEGDAFTQAAVGAPLSRIASETAAKIGDYLDILIADARYSLANTIANRVEKHTQQLSYDVTHAIDRIVLNRILGIPIFLCMMYLMFMFTIQIGGAFIDFFEKITESVLITGVESLLNHMHAPQWLSVLLANGIGSGIQTVATFIPLIGSLYLFLSILEDSGYMARAAFVMDRLIRWIGLPGKAFVPLIVGFGCNVPSIMAARTLDNPRDRLMTTAMAPFMSCGARLPVYVLFAAAFFPYHAQNIVFGLYLLGIVAAILTGLVLHKTLLRGQASPFIMELPSYHIPTVRGILTLTWDRLKNFILRAGRVIVPMVLILNILNAVGTDGSFGNENTQKSVLSAIGRSITPVFHPLGIQENNWPAAVGIFTGILAKETVIGTLNSTYKSLSDAAEDTASKEESSLAAQVSDAFATIPAKLKEVFSSWNDPLKLMVGDLSDQESVAKEKEVSNSLFGELLFRFGGTASAMAYLIFILLYFPCTAVIAVIHQESGARWAGFVACWTTGLAYGVATLYYQIATFNEHPLYASTWIAIVTVTFCLVLLLMRYWAKRQESIPGWVPSCEV